MALFPLFFAQLNLELAYESIAEIALNSHSVIYINGMMSLLLLNIQINYKFTKLICYLNPEGSKRSLKRENFSKANFIDSTSLNGKINQRKYSHIEICLKFENSGNYFIIFSNIFNAGWLQFYVKIKKAKEEKCVFKMFKKISDLDKNLLKGLSHRIAIHISQTEVNDIEDGPMNVYSGHLFHKHPETELVAQISPMINDGSYEFYLDEDGITKERMKLFEPNFKN